MVELTIDGRPLQAREGSTVLETALANGIDIPRLCYHPELLPSGACRLCLVEVEGRPAPVVSCGLTVAPGLKITTQSERLYRYRREVISLLLSDHPLRCVVCDKAGKCGLQKYAYEFGLAESTFRVEISRSLYQDDNPFFVRDHQACILCGRCVRVCDEVVGANAIEQAGRGFFAHVATPFDMPMVESSCVFCGNCVALCPTSALMPKARLKQGREWDLECTRTVCGYCGVGCTVEIMTSSKGQIVDVRGDTGSPATSVNGEMLCVKGRFGWEFLQHPDRLTKPLVRRDLAERMGLASHPPAPLSVHGEGGERAPRPPLSARGEGVGGEVTPVAPPSPVGKGAGGLGPSSPFVEVSWDAALDLVASRLAETVRAHGPDAVAGLASAKCTNEENYVFQKLMRVALGTNNVDHCARLCHASTVAGLARSFGSGAMTNSIREIRDADCVLVTGSNTTEAHPVISYEIVRAVRRGASLIVVDPRRIALAEKATLFLQPLPGTDYVVFLAMIDAIIRNGWLDHEFVETRTEGFEAMARSVSRYTPELASKVSGVPADLILRAARVYALGLRAAEAERTLTPPSAPLSREAGEGSGVRGASSILYAMGITQRSHGTDIVQTLANLAMVAGQIGRPSTGVNPLRGQCNVQGACDAGALPDLYPGYQRVADESVRRTMAERWQVESLPDSPGLTVVEMMHAALRGDVKAMCIMGENPMVSDPNLSHVKEALSSLPFLVVQDIFLTETAQLAHVVLPATAFAEKSGTYTSTERRVQLLRPAIEAPGEAREDLQIVAELARRIDAKLGVSRPAGYWDFPTQAAAMLELGKSAPIYGGITHERVADGGLCWPCPSADHPGTPILHVGRFTRGKGLFHAIEYQPAAEVPDAEYPLILTTGRMLYHYHTGSMTRRDERLDWREPRAYAEINERDAQEAGVRDGGPVEITSRRGTIRSQARVGNRVPAGVVFVPMHFAEAAANVLTQDSTLDPVAKIPEFKVSAVRIGRPTRARVPGR